MAKPKKWTDVYPQGTKDGDEEAAFFKTLGRDPNWDWRSTKAIVKGSKLPQERVEELIEKYTNTTPPLVYPHPKNEDQWGYWERVPDQVPEDDEGLSKADKKNRIGNHLDGN